MVATSVMSANAQTASNSTGMQEVHDFVKKCGHYFIATVEGDQPRVRAFGTIHIFENKLYIQTGKAKKVAQQIKANPKIEICAFDGDKSWIRIQAVATEDNRREAKQSILDAYPDLKSMYSADDNKTQVYYLKEATAYISSFSGETKVIKF
ncbi:MAG: pyridoxamine 5'-phosphate oxidase family protein [Bacteroidales bacterium]|nr:pyridoxamine 5'-phosphate oxidase family protein [Bacteroidales bacterium]